MEPGWGRRAVRVVVGSKGEKGEAASRVGTGVGTRSVQGISPSFFTERKIIDIYSYVHGMRIV